MGQRVLRVHHERSSLGFGVVRAIEKDVIQTGHVSEEVDHLQSRIGCRLIDRSRNTTGRVAGPGQRYIECRNKAVQICIDHINAILGIDRASEYSPCFEFFQPKASPPVHEGETGRWGQQIAFSRHS